MEPKKFQLNQLPVKLSLIGEPRIHYEGSTKSTVCEIVFDWGSTYLEMKVPIIIGDKAVALFTNKVQPIHVWNIGTIRVPTKSTVCEIVLDWETLTKNILYFLREKRT